MKIKESSTPNLNPQKSQLNAIPTLMPTLSYKYKPKEMYKLSQEVQWKTTEFKSPLHSQSFFDRFPDILNLKIRKPTEKEESKSRTATFEIFENFQPNKSQINDTKPQIKNKNQIHKRKLTVTFRKSDLKREREEMGSQNRPCEARNGKDR